MSEYKLVPVEPTAEMLGAPLQGGRFENRVDLRNSIYRAMLAAAPAVQGEPEITPEMIEAGARHVTIIDSAAESAEKVYRAMRAAAPQPAEQPFEWPLLDAPALIGGAVVGKGCSTGTVVAIAKRAYQYAVETSPEEHARREKAFKDVLAQIHEGINQSGPEHMPGENAPDVEALVEALETACEYLPIGSRAFELASIALAAHRKQQEGEA